MAIKAPIRQRRGQPLVVLCGLLLAWISLRAAALSLGVQDPAGQPSALTAGPAEIAAVPASPSLARPPATSRETHQGAPPGALWDQPVRASPQPLPPRPVLPTIITPSQPRPANAWPPSEAFARPRPARAAGFGNPMASFRMVAGHQLLYSAGLAALPLPLETAALQARRDKAQPARAWSVDAWLLWRQGGAVPVPLALGSGSYGASQAGLILRYKLAPVWNLTGYARLSAPLERPEEAELAGGLLVRPWRKLPVQAFAEVRASRTGRTASGQASPRAALGVVSGVGPLGLPLGFQAEPYFQAGYVAGPGATFFADGQVRVDRRITRVAGLDIRAGGGVWGGAQRGAARLDAGPGVALHFPLGPAQARLSADWRQRIMGKAKPDSGMAVTLATGF